MKLKLQKSKFKKRLKSTFIFDKDIAKSFCKIEYYKAQAQNMKAHEFILQEKQRLRTPKPSQVSEILEHYTEKGENHWLSPVAKALIGIYHKNTYDAISIKQDGVSKAKKSTNLLNIVARPEMLLLAYKAIKGNKGAMSEAGKLDINKLKTFTEDQMQVYIRGLSFPDKFSLQDVFMISALLKKGLYPWCSSRRVYIPKPGSPSKQRPITIPPFMDRVVQKAISMVLEAIYEPYFEMTNRSFGFRPNKGCHEAITALTSTYSSGKITALEGDIEGAYDTVNKDILIEILGKKIQDRKFLQLIRDRLDYDFEEKGPEGIVRFRPPKGIPQGGIDSPYLFNIYMMELDYFVNTEIQAYVDQQNNTLETNSKGQIVRKFKHSYNSNKAELEKLQRQRKNIKKRLQEPGNESVLELKKLLYANIKETRLAIHRKNSMKSEHPHNRELKILYVRYADDWIILTNGNKQIAEQFKTMISNFLLSKLQLKLSEEKTMVTDIRLAPARFLGFELRHPRTGPLVRVTPRNTTKVALKGLKKKTTLQRKAGTVIWATVDKQRLINRLHMKGFCDKNGVPKEVPWLSCMEAHVIVERFNAVIRGFAEYYYGFIRNRSDMQRWIYILTYSCIKTLAQKYRTTTNGVFKKFGVNLASSSTPTIRVRVRLKVQDEIYEKDWTLWSYSLLMKELQKSNKRKKTVADSFWRVEKQIMVGEYPGHSGKLPSVTTKDYLDKISWVSLRTQASFDMPCASCGSDKSVHQHHVRHIRKTAYELISQSMPYKQVLALRNRKQIPLCPICHRNLVHAGQYDGQALIKLVPQRLMDNRIVHVETFVKPGITPHAKSLVDKGWKMVK